MGLSPGIRIGPYQVVGLLGVGGMGEVYRARDDRLKRDVALKILPDQFAANPDRLARFEREAQMLAALNHPNIASIYGLEHGDGVRALVLELVEGDTLADRISRGPMPIDEARAIAVQIAQALETAHDQGIIHRDLKPANIKVTPAGTVKVLDLGLARVMEPAGPEDPASFQHAGRDLSPAALSQSPTLASPVAVTGAGTLLGTAAYMAPEQAKGRPADKRSDVWAFGCVLFEMLTGQRPFAADDVTETLATILMREPDWTALPEGIPTSIRRLLHRCIQKDPARRLRSFGDARLELDDDAEQTTPNSPVAAPGRTPHAWVPWSLALVALAAAVWALWLGRVQTESSPLPVVRMEVNLPPGVELYSSNTRTLAMSPDGSQIAFVGIVGGARQIYVRELRAFNAVPLKGTENTTSFFFSPDGQALAFSTSPGVLKTVSLRDGSLTTLSERATVLLGGSWGPDNRIVFSRGGALWIVPATGGMPEPLTTLSGAPNDTLHAWPLVLPESGAVLFAAAAGDRWRIDALDVTAGTRTVVVEDATLPMYAGNGRLIFARGGELMVVPFDVNRLVTTGPASRVDEAVPVIGTVPNVDVSASGSGVYAASAGLSRLVWVGRDGTETPLNDVVRAYGTPQLAPDGRRLLVQAGDLYIQDLLRGTFSRLVSRDIGANAFPVWTSDSRVVFRTPQGFRVLDTEGGGRDFTMADTGLNDYPMSLTPDGKTLLLARGSEAMSLDIYALPLAERGTATPIVSTPAYEGGGRLSPDGRWLAYVSNESGANEVYLRAYPQGGRRWQVSIDGATQPIWNPNGREIFYRNGNGMMAVDVVTTPDVVLSRPKLLFEGRYAYGAGLTISNYDVDRDGRRFIMVKDATAGDRLNVVLNWFAGGR